MMAPSEELNLTSRLLNAQELLAGGHLYEAKKETQAILETHPDHFEAQQLMGKILDQEISNYKEAIANPPAEELSAAEKKLRVKTWLERGKSLLDEGFYDQAAEAVENVFTLDAHNQEASRLLDTIKQKAWERGKQEIMSGKAVARAEADDRVTLYHTQAKEAFLQGRLGEAQLTVEKILLLSPEDEEALDLQKQIQKRQNHETR